MQNDLFDRIEKLKQEETKIVYIKEIGTLFPTLEIKGSAVSLESMFAALTCHMAKELGKKSVMDAFQRGPEFWEEEEASSDFPC